MATYVIGDVQGCYRELRALLARVAYTPATDRLWFVGDLVNRGPRSLATLRFVRDLGDGARMVLGNHDLHLLAAAAGIRRPRRKDTMQEILDAPDRDELVAWLRTRPVVLHDVALDVLMVHAGLAPQWTVAVALALARELEDALRGEGWLAFLAQMYGNQPDLWDDALSGNDRLRFITNAFTRVRYVDAAGRLDMLHSGPPGTQGRGRVPWFEARGRLSAGTRIVFGHWATLQLEQRLRHPEVMHVDTGCVWGGTLTALRLEDGQRFQVPAGAT